MDATVWVKRSGWDGTRPDKRARTHAITCHFVQKYGDAGYKPVPARRIPADTPSCRWCGGGPRVLLGQSAD